jgi:dsDNA-specific endonuclease/ATPase MutS2
LEVKYSLRTEVAENFIKGLKGLFEENYIDIPDDEVSVVDELTEAVEGYKDRIDEQTEMLEELHKEVLSFRKNSVVEEVTDGLTETQKIRLEKLSESVEAETTDEFKEKLNALKEAYFDNPEIAAKALSSYGDEVHSMNEGNVALNEDGSPVSQYAKFLSKTVLK